ncbi:MAG: YkgJ family cysteine cluster protein [Fimbriiglobus sp.]
MDALPLSRSYTCRFGAPTIDRVDPRIFTLTYFGVCMDCTFCHDACCQYGADTELPRVAELEKYQAELEAYLGVPRAEWFREDPDDFGVLDEPEYPGGKYTRTQVVELPAGRSPHAEWACVFLDPVGRGCRIHRFAFERGIPVHEIKPMVCLLFPVSVSDAVLGPAYEFDIEGELVCAGHGVPLYGSARPDLEYYFGPELIAELDAMEKAHPVPGKPGTVPLPTCP